MGLPSKWILYNDALLNIGKKLEDLALDSFKVALFSASSIAKNEDFAGASYTAAAADGNEVAEGNGYLTGGVSVDPPQWVGASDSDIATFFTADATWTGTDGGFTAAVAMLYDDTTAGKLALAFCKLNVDPGDGSLLDAVWPTGIPISIVISAKGVFIARKACPTLPV